jgi:hypothetical protein
MRVIAASPSSWICTNKAAVTSGWLFGGTASMTTGAEALFRRIVQ